MMIPFMGMSDGMIDRAAERHYDRMLSRYQHEDEPDPECGNCYWWNNDTGVCDRLLAELPDQQGEEYAITMPDDYCEEYEPQEADEDDGWASDDAWEGRFDRE